MTGGGGVVAFAVVVTAGGGEVVFAVVVVAGGGVVVFAAVVAAGGAVVVFTVVVVAEAAVVVAETVVSRVTGSPVAVSETVSEASGVEPCCVISSLLEQEGTAAVAAVISSTAVIFFRVFFIWLLLAHFLTKSIPRLLQFAAGNILKDFCGDHAVPISQLWRNGGAPVGTGAGGEAAIERLRRSIQ